MAKIAPPSADKLLIAFCFITLIVLIPIAMFFDTHTSNSLRQSTPVPVANLNDLPPTPVDIGPSPLNAGDKAPSFTTTTLDGTTLNSDSLLGHVTILDFWATWCGPCRMLIPDLETLHKQYSPLGVNFVGMSVDTDTASQVKPFAKQMGMRYTVTVNPTQNTAAEQNYNATGLPSVYVIDKHGRVRWSAGGYFFGEKDYLSKVIDILRAEP